MRELADSAERGESDDAMKDHSTVRAIQQRSKFVRRATGRSNSFRCRLANEAGTDAHAAIASDTIDTGC